MIILLIIPSLFDFSIYYNQIYKLTFCRIFFKGNQQVTIIN